MHRLPGIVLLMTLIVLSSSPPYAAVRLQQVGSGTVRYLGLITVYDATLLAAPGASETGVLNGVDSFCLQLDYHVELSADVFIEAAETVLARQHDAATLAPLKDRIDALHRSYRAVRPGDRYRFCYDRLDGLSRLSLNGETLAAIDSPAFAAVYAGIWLDPDEPLDQSLRDRLCAGLPKESQP